MGNRSSKVRPAGIASPRRPAAAASGLSVSGTAPDGKPGYVLTEEERKRVLTDAYIIPTSEFGRGHYGVVRIGTDKATGEKVAIKTVPKRRAVYIEMLRLEVEILRKVSHVNIITLIDVFEDEQDVHMVFESCTGGELFESIANRQFRFSEFEASTIMRKILRAMLVLHKDGIVHRDLKPENILFSEPGVDSEVKVIDFGLATFAAPNTVLKKHVGTPYYIAPEVIAKAYNKECDLWSLGVILFTLMCGYPPFWGDTEREIYGRVKRGHYAFEGPDWQVRSPAAKDLVNMLLVMQPSARFTVEQALKHPWIVYEGQPAPSSTSKKLFGKLRKFTAGPLLKRLALLVLARLLPEDDINKQLEWFHNVDRSDRGYITHQDLLQAARDRGMTMSDREVDALVREVGILREGVITFHEFVAATLPRTVYLEDAHIAAMFSGLDADGDGRVTEKDLRTLLGTQDEYAKAILLDCDVDPAFGLEFADYFSVICGSEFHHY